ncbi:MAG: metallophosphoesterase [Chloroflexi bacterium]|nr:metallophosphoesterase [Chloroflexota bacterium]
MRCLTLADEVIPAVYSLNARERFAGVACVLACGDLPYYYLEFVVTTLAVPCLYVPGNHDRPEQSSTGEVLLEPRGCVSLHGRALRLGGMLFAGAGGSLRYNRSSGAQYTEREQMLRLLRLAPALMLNRARYGRYLDVLLTHAPPHGIHNGPDRPHAGFRAFRWFMRRFEPRYLIHGHIHRSYGFSPVFETRLGPTQVINTAGHRVIDIVAASSMRRSTDHVPDV